MEAFLSHLAVDAKVAAATENQALSALLFLYREVPGVTLPWLGTVNPRQTAPAPAGGVDARGGARGPVADAGRVAAVAGLLFGTGMHLRECVRLRVKDVEFAQRQIIVRDGRAPGIG